MERGKTHVHTQKKYAVASLNKEGFQVEVKRKTFKKEHQSPGRIFGPG